MICKTLIQAASWAVVLCLAGIAQAATLTAESVAGAAPGASGVMLTIDLAASAGEQVCGVQVDIEFDSDALSVAKAAAGTSATDAGKSVSLQTIASGVARLVVTGINQKVMADGPVATLSFSVADAATAAVYPIALTEAMWVNPYGLSYAAQTVDGSISVSAAAEGEGEQSCGCLGGVTNTRYPGDWPNRKMDAIVLMLAGAVLLTVRDRRRCGSRDRQV